MVDSIVGGKKRMLVILAAIAIVAAACQGGATPQPSASAAASKPAASAAPSQPSGSAAASASPSAAALESELVLNNCGGTYGDALQTAYVIPFQSETGVKVTFDDACDDQATKLPAQDETGQVQWDVVGGLPAPQYQALYDDGILVKLDHDALGSNAANLAEGSIEPWGLASNFEAVVLGYRQTAFPGRTLTIADFFDPAGTPGDRALVGQGFEAWNPLAMALVADGVPPAELTPLDFDRAFKKLDTVKPYVKVYYESGSQMLQLMLDSQAVLCLCTDGRMLQAQKSDEDIRLTFEGALRTPIFWAIPTKAAHPNAAMAFLKSTLDPGRQAVFTNIIGYSGASQESYKLLPPERQDQVLANPANFAPTFAFTPEQNAYFAENASDITERWSTWLSQ